MLNFTQSMCVAVKNFLVVVSLLLIISLSRTAFAQWDSESCKEAKDWAKLAVVEYTTGRDLDQTLGYARSLYGRSGGVRVSEDAALMAVRFTWRYLVNLGMPRSPPPPDMQIQVYNDIQNDFYQWCISSQ